MKELKEKYLALKVYDEESMKKIKLPKGTWTTILLKLKTGEIVVAEYFPVGGWGYCDIDLVNEKRYNEMIKADPDFYDGKSQAEIFFSFLKNCFEIKREKNENRSKKSF